MKTKNKLKKIFSLQTLKKATLLLLVIFLGSVSVLVLSIHQTWRYIKVTHPNEVIIPKNPDKPLNENKPAIWLVGFQKPSNANDQ